MSDITDKINEILNSEEGMNQVKSLAQSLGLNLPEENQSPVQTSPNNTSQTPQINPQMLMSLQNMISGINKNDGNTALLQALKPHLSENRRKKVDDAVKIMQLVKIFPVLKQSGLFGGEKID